MLVPHRSKQKKFADEIEKKDTTLTSRYRVAGAFSTRLPLTIILEIGSVQFGSRAFRGLFVYNRATTRRPLGEVEEQQFE